MDSRIGWSVSLAELDQRLADIVSGFNELVLLGYGVIEIPFNGGSLDLVEELASSIHRLGCRTIVVSGSNISLLQTAEINIRLSRLGRSVHVFREQAEINRDRKQSAPLTQANNQSTEIDTLVETSFDSDIRLKYFFSKPNSCSAQEPEYLSSPNFAHLTTRLTDGLRANKRHLQLLAEDMSERNFYGPIICQSDIPCSTPSAMIPLARDLLRRMDKIDWIRFH